MMALYSMCSPAGKLTAAWKYSAACSSQFAFHISHVCGRFGVHIDCGGGSQHNKFRRFTHVW